MKKYWLISCVLLCTACVSVPPELELPENTNIASFSEAKSSTAGVIGQTARWGGIIAEIKNNADNTMLEIVNFTLSPNLRPKKGDETLGRFRLYVDGLLDPIIYKKGRSITAVGKVSELESGKIGEHEYNFPVLKQAKVHLWKNIQRIDVNVMSQSYWPYSYPYFWSGNYLNYNRPVVVRSIVNKSNNKQYVKSKSSSEKTKK